MALAGMNRFKRYLVGRSVRLKGVSVCEYGGESDEFWITTRVDGDITYVRQTRSCLFGSKSEVFVFGLVEFEVPVKLCGND